MNITPSVPAPAALITGSARRVGRAIALHLAAAGYDIVLHYRHSEQEAHETAAAIQAVGRRCVLLQADMAGQGAMMRLMQEAHTALPRLNTLINNASIFERQPFLEMEESHFAEHLAVNFSAPVFLMQAFAHQCREGHIINLIDTHHLARHSPFFAYLLSKKALLEATFMAAHDLTPSIQVNAVCPGLVLPSGESFGEDYMVHHAASLPQQRLATPEEVAATVLMLLTSPGLTGQCLYVDGGEQLR